MHERRFKEAEERETGFTLIELLVVIIIIGILAAIAIPVFLNQRNKGYEAQARADLRNIATAEETYLTESPTGYVACDGSTGASGCVATLSSLVWKPSPNAVTAVGADGALGYCAVSKATPPGDYVVYDSEAGGIQPGAALSFAAINWPAGACATPGARPSAF